MLQKTHTSVLTKVSEFSLNLLNADNVTKNEPSTLSCKLNLT